MARFQELNEYINQVLLKLIESQDLCKYLHYETKKTIRPIQLITLI